MKQLPAQDHLNSILAYCPETGLLSWKIRVAQNSPPGKRAGTLSKANGYIVLSIKETLYLAHRLIWRMETGVDPLDGQIDHINGLRHDNRWSNLRLVTQYENQWNRRRSRLNKSGFKGVHFEADARGTKKFRACIRLNGKTKHLGRYVTADEAHAAYQAAALVAYGEFCRFD